MHTGRAAQHAAAAKSAAATNCPRLIPPTIIAGGAAGKAISDATKQTELSRERKAAAEYVEAARKAGVVFPSTMADQSERGNIGKH